MQPCNPKGIYFSIGTIAVVVVVEKAVKQAGKQDIYIKHNI